MDEIVKLAVPVLFSTRPAVPFVPMVTVPKLIALGVTDSCGSDAAAAVAERFAATGVLPESPVTVNVPAMVPAAVASTATLKLLDWPTASATGMLSPDTLNCEFETLACVMCIAIGPEFVTDTDCVTCFPTVTFPNAMLPVLSWNTPFCEAELPCTTKPEHPFNITTAGSKNTQTSRNLSAKLALAALLGRSTPSCFSRIE